MKLWFAAGVAVVLLAGTVRARVWYVAPGGTSDFTDIQTAIYAAADADEIVVYPGTYAEALWVFQTNLTLRSSNPLDRAVVQSTVVTKPGYYVFYLAPYSKATVMGFTIGKGGTGIHGGSSNCLIQQNIITSNSHTGIDACPGMIQENLIFGNGNSGLRGCHGLVQSNTIAGNSTLNYGPALYLCNGVVQYNTVCSNGPTSHAVLSAAIDSCSGMVMNNAIADNQCAGICNCAGSIEGNTLSRNDGGGLVACDGATPIRDNLIADNPGGGLRYCSAAIINNRIVRNTAIVGGGLFFCGGMIVSNCIVGNCASLGGGLAYCRGDVRANVISANVASSVDQGGGALYNCSGVVQGNIMAGNIASNGAGIYLTRQHATIRNNLLVGNTAAATAGGIYVSECSPDIQNNTVVNNTAGIAGGGVYLDAAYASSNLVLRNCILWSNQAPAKAQYGADSNYAMVIPHFCCVQDGTNAYNCMGGNPRFVGSNDYHLADHSPCIDAGTNLSDTFFCTDLDGKPRVINNIVDMGCYEHGWVPEPLTTVPWLVLAALRRRLFFST